MEHYRKLYSLAGGTLMYQVQPAAPALSAAALLCNVNDHTLTYTEQRPSPLQVGSWYNIFRVKAQRNNKILWQPGTATFTYPNTQQATTLWYHDHT